MRAKVPAGDGPQNRRRLRRRLIWSAAVATGAVVGASVAIPSYGGLGTGHSKSLLRAYNVTTKVRNGLQQDQASKNLISAQPGRGRDDRPTTPAEEQRSLQAVEAQRNEPVPNVVPIAK